MKDFCTVCDKETEHKKGKKHYSIQIGDITVEGDIYGYICQECYEDVNITDSSEFDRKYTSAYREYHNHMLTGEQIKAVRNSKKMSKTKFVNYLKEQGINYNLDEYQEIENDTRAQSGAMEMTIRTIGGYPEWKGYKIATE